MIPSRNISARRRRRLERLARVAVQGTLVAVKLRCGTKSCGCHRDPQLRHGPHLYLKYRSAEGRSTGMYVPREYEGKVRRAVEAWEQMWQTMVALGHGNRERLRREMRGRRKGNGAKGR